MTHSLTSKKPPFYVCDLSRARQRYHAIVDAFAKHVPNVILAYSYKTNYLPVLCRALHAEGAWAEVVSGVEYQLARRLGVVPSKIVFNGTGRTMEELAPALKEGALVNLDSLAEVAHVARWAREHRGRRVEVGLRVNLALPEALRGRERSRFGLSVASAEIERALELLESAGVGVVGVHAHLSSKRRDADVFRGLLDELLGAAGMLGARSLKYLDIGGGLGYAPDGMESLAFPSFEQYAELVAGILRERDVDLSATALVVEPGMALVCDCLSYYADVRALKEIDGRRVAVVGGSVHTVKPTRHGYHLPTTVLDRDFVEKRTRPTRYDVVGYTCMEDDFLAVDQELPELSIGDILRLDAVGAYSVVFKPPFIQGAPPIYALDGEALGLVRRAEELADFVAGYELDE